MSSRKGHPIEPPMDAPTGSTGVCTTQRREKLVRHSEAVNQDYGSTAPGAGDLVVSCAMGRRLVKTGGIFIVAAVAAACVYLACLSQ